MPKKEKKLTRRNFLKAAGAVAGYSALQACGADATLRKRVKALLSASEKADSFMDVPIGVVQLTDHDPAEELSGIGEGPGDRPGRRRHPDGTGPRPTGTRLPTARGAPARSRGCRARARARRRLRRRRLSTPPPPGGYRLIPRATAAPGRGVSLGRLRGSRADHRPAARPPACRRGRSPRPTARGRARTWRSGAGRGRASRGLRPARPGQRRGAARHRGGQSQGGSVGSGLSPHIGAQGPGPSHRRPGGLGAPEGQPRAPGHGQRLCQDRGCGSDALGCPQAYPKTRGRRGPVSPGQGPGFRSCLGDRTGSADHLWRLEAAAVNPRSR